MKKCTFKRWYRNKKWENYVFKFWHKIWLTAKNYGCKENWFSIIGSSTEGGFRPDVWEGSFYINEPRSMVREYLHTVFLYLGKRKPPHPAPLRGSALAVYTIYKSLKSIRFSYKTGLVILGWNTLCHSILLLSLVRGYVNFSTYFLPSFF